MHNDENNAILKKAPPQLAPVLGKNEGKIIVTRNPGNIFAKLIIGRSSSEIVIARAQDQSATSN
jgi:hypothetical protein